MKSKLTALILAMAMAISFGAVLNDGVYAQDLQESPTVYTITAKPGMRYAMGEIIGRYYHEYGDYTSVKISTYDGNIWGLECYTAPLTEKCLVSFDTNGTEDLTDDTITAVYMLSDTLDEYQTTSFIGTWDELGDVYGLREVEDD